MREDAQDTLQPHVDPAVWHGRSLAVLLAWAGLGANGLSAACYGPEKAYLALGGHAALGPLLALCMVVSVAVVALALTQMFELFPAGGGSYRVTTQLLGPKPGLIAGAALLVDYILAIAVSLASGVDALFSLLPQGLHSWKLPVELAIVALLVILNVRGMRIAIRFLLPVVIAFTVAHLGVIVLGIGLKAPGLVADTARAAGGAVDVSQPGGWTALLALLVRAYGLGGSTYSGVEAVSNNVNLLAEPRLRTGRFAMLWVALTLACLAGGLLLLYSLWHAIPEPGRTLNASLFSAILPQLGLDPEASRGALVIMLGLEAAILTVAANSILIFAPSLLANMAADSWLPHQFRNLSVRLQRQNGVVSVGLVAGAMLYATHGDLAVLVAFYSTNVFLSLAMGKAGLLRHWWRQRTRTLQWLSRVAIAGLGFAIAFVIFLVTLHDRLSQGSWATIGLTLLVLLVCLRIHAHYTWVSDCRRRLDEQFALRQEELASVHPVARFEGSPTILLLTRDHSGLAVYTILWIQRLFPGHFRNVLFLSVIEYDARALGAAETLERRKRRFDAALRQAEAFCAKAGLSASHVIGCGTDPVLELERLVKEATARIPDCVCFANKLILPRGRRVAEWLHNQTALGLQRRLHGDGIPLVVFPIRLGWD